MNTPPPVPITAYPPPEKWDDVVEYDPKAWPRKVEKHYMLVPTVCFNCEAACGLLAFVDKADMTIRKMEGNPHHPGSRGRNCAKGPATMAQTDDPERILHPLKRVGPRGSGKWARVSWDEVLDHLAAELRKALVEDRRTEVMYHVGRPGHDGYIDRVLQAWGVDGHNSHTNICSGGARTGYQLWMGSDRPSPDYANARFILMLSSHLEAGHYFNPHAQRIIEAKMAGAKIAVIDVRLSNTASMADWWLPTWPGSEAALLLAMASVLIEEGLVDWPYVEAQVNWRAWMAEAHPDSPDTFEAFKEKLTAEYAGFTPEFAAGETGIDPAVIRDVAREIGAAGSRFASHVWRNAASGNLGGWQVSRALMLLNVLTGSVGTEGGVLPHDWNKFVPKPFVKPPAQTMWSELLFPREWPLAHYEMSELLPHLLKEGRGKLSLYFTRVFNPVWTYPDGFSWIEALRDESKIGIHAAITPTWSETAWYADYVLPTGMAAERHDLMSQETHSGQWISFRQPVLRRALERMGRPVRDTRDANPGEVWEEDELWIELSWRADPDGSLGVRKYFESPYRPGEKITIDEYYRWIFENSVPGLPEAAAAEGLDPWGYMTKYGAFEVKRDVYRKHEADGGWPTPSRKLELYSPTMRDWGWPEHALPGYIMSHVHRSQIGPGEYLLVPTFRLPVLIHSRSGNAKWLNEIAHRNPLWMHPRDATALGVTEGDLVRVTTEIGWFVLRVWPTEGIRPGVVGCSHHLGRWRLQRDGGGERWSTAVVRIEEQGEGRYMMRQVEGIAPFVSSDKDSARIWWTDAGVHQNITFPVHPDPISGMHCWHQKVRIEKAHPGDAYGDVYVDTTKSFEIYLKWKEMTRPAPGPDGLRRPLWLKRPVRPTDEAFKL
ncbi:MAG: formate dehydrogenase [Proteobacteria bacterium]|nr:formate dehydrogenase [Pseudomonadota bacterium]